MKLKVIQKVFLAVACLLYAGFLFSFVRTLNYGILGCGIGMGVFFLLVVMLGLPKDEDYDEDFEPGSEPTREDEQVHGDRVNVNALIDQLSERREDLEAAQSDLKVRDDEIERLNRRFEEAKRDASDVASQKSFLEEKVASLERQLEEANHKLAEATGAGYETILPDAKNDPPMVINIGEAAQKAADDLSEAAEKAGISIHTISTDATLMVKASPSMIDVLFKNIIDNAIKYMSKEGTLQITISRIEEELFIVMKDNGEGLSPAETEHIFELNYQGSNRISGNGLGLAQARAIVEYYGGMIYARSSRGSGMGIYIHLPSAL